MRKIKSVLMALIYVLIFFLAQVAASLAVPIYTFLNDLVAGKHSLYVLIQNFRINASHVSVDSNFVIIVSYIMALWLYATINFLRRRGLNIRTKKLKVLQVFYALGLAVALNVIAAYITSLDIFRNMIPQYENTIEGILRGVPWVTILVVGVLAPVFEEVLCRGLILGELQGSFNFYVANFIHALIFGVMHGNIIQGTYAAVIGFVLGMAYKMSGTIYFTVLIHIFINLGNVLMAIAAGL